MNNKKSLSEIRHTLKNPLSTISLTAEIVLKNNKNILKPEDKNYLKDIIKESKKLAAMIDKNLKD